MPYVTTISLYEKDVEIADEIRRLDPARPTRTAAVRRAMVNELARMRAEQAQDEETRG